MKVQLSVYLPRISRKARRLTWLLFGLVAATALALRVQADSNSVLLINADSGGITNYTGSGIVIGEIDVAPGVADSNHVFLAGQIIGTTNLATGTAGGVDPHATQVAGVMVSTDSVVRGVAPGAQVYSVELGGSLVSAEYFLATQQNARVINQSLGTDSVSNFVQGATNFVVRVLNPVGTSVVERAMDRVVTETGAIIVQAAGNEGNIQSLGAGSAGGTNTVVLQAGAYNLIVVGAVNNATSGQSTNIATYSSRGYLADGRSAITLVAPGSGIIMPTTPPGGSGTAVATNNGTSFATPHVAAAVARLLEVGDTISADAVDPRTIKAVLMNQADKLPGWSPGQTFTLAGSGGPDIRQPLDFQQGAGLLDLGKSYDQLVAGEYHPTIVNNGPVGAAVPEKGWDVFSVNFGLTNSYRIAQPAGGEMRLALDWYRNVGPTVAGTNSVTSFNDLDLYLWRSADAAFTNLTLVARSASTVDNVELLYLTNMPIGYYQFGVVFHAQNVGADASESYALAWDIHTVPEPSTLLLMMTGAYVIHRYRQRRPARTKLG